MFNKKNIIIILITLMFVGSCSKEVSKMQITANSIEAKELYLKGLSLADRLRREEAVQYFEDAIALDSNLAMAYLGLAFAQLNQNLFFPNINKAISLKDKVSEGEQLWIDATEAQINNQLSESRKIIRKLLALYPKDERVHNFYATSFFGTQDYQESIVHYLKALEINPKYSPVYNQLGYAYRFLQNYNEAEKMFQKYIELIPNDPNPYDSYGELLMKMGNFNESIRNYEKALRVNPYFTFSYLGIASNLNYKDEHVKARNKLQKLFKSAKDNTQRRIALNGIIISYADEGNLEAAYKMSYKRRQIAVDESDSVTISNIDNSIGILLFEMDKYSEAIQQFTKANNILQSIDLPEQVKVNTAQNYNVNVAMVELIQGNSSEVRKIADEFIAYANQQNNPNLIRFANQVNGMIAYEEKDYDVAIEYLRQSNQNNPYNIYRLALAYEKKGDSERANSYFEKAAHANTVSSLNYSLIRKKALAKIQ